MIPLTRITWQYVSNHGEDRRGRKTKTVYYNVRHIYMMEELDYGTRIHYGSGGAFSSSTVEETPAQISLLAMKYEQTIRIPS